MININKILKQSWHILWNYRVLWVFGFLLALTSAGGGRSNFNYTANGNRRYIPPAAPSGNEFRWMRELTQYLEQNVNPLFENPGQHVTTLIWIGVGFLLFILLVSAIIALVRYPSEIAVMRMVDEYEQSGAKLGFRQGWRLGWSRRAFRLWLIDLILSIPAFLLVLMLIAVGLVIYFSVANGLHTAGIIGMVAAVGVTFLVLFLMIILMVFLGVLRNFFARVASLEGQGVRASLRDGWAMFKNNWKSVGLMWLVMVGIGIVYAIAGIFLFFLLIPGYLVLLVPAALVALIPGLLAYGITSLFASGPLAYIFGILAAMMVFFPVLFAPLLFIGGWYMIFESNVWTLTYREIKALAVLSTPPSAIESVEPPAPEVSE